MPTVPDFALERLRLQEEQVKKMRQRAMAREAADLLAARRKLDSEGTGSNEEADMSNLTREQLEDKLDAAAARTEAIIARIEGKIELISQSHIDLKEDGRNSRTLFVGLAITLLLTIIGTAWAVFSGITANNASLVQSVTGAFSLGRDTGQQIEQVKAQGTTPTSPK